MVRSLTLRVVVLFSFFVVCVVTHTTRGARTACFVRRAEFPRPGGACASTRARTHSPPLSLSLPRSAAVEMAVSTSVHDDAAASPWAQRIFAAFDADGSGAVSPAELGVGLHALLAAAHVSDEMEGEEAAEKMDAVCRSTFAQYDADGDGVITLGEFTEKLARSLRMAEAVAEIYGGAVDVEAGAVRVDVKTRAKRTALKCFEIAGVERDGALTLPLFAAWFYSQSAEDESPI